MSIKHENLPLANHSLEELLPDSLMSSPSVSIRTTDTMDGVVSLLAHNLESFTDSLVVIRNDNPVGVVGGIEFLQNFLKNPTFSSNTLVADIMSEKLVTITKETRLSDLIKQWLQNRRAFAIIPNQYHGHSAISARKLLEVGIRCKTMKKVSDIPKKKVITFGKNDTIKELITSMFENKTRKLILENTPLFVSDRIIIEKIARELNYLQNVSKFLDMKSDMLKLEAAKVISEDLEIPKVSKMMSDMSYPYVMTTDQVISPWDIVVMLGSKDLVDYQ